MILWNLNHDRCLVIKQHTRIKRVTFVRAWVNIARISRSTQRWHACNNMSAFLQEFVAIPSSATQQESSSHPSEDEEIRHTQEKASVGGQVLALLSFLKPFFRVTVEKYTKFLQRIIRAWYFFKSTAIIVSVAKETIGIRPDDVISAYNGGKLNFPWPTENLNFAPRMRMPNWRPSLFKAGGKMADWLSENDVPYYFLLSLSHEQKRRALGSRLTNGPAQGLRDPEVRFQVAARE